MEHLGRNRVSSLFPVLCPNLPKLISSHKRHIHTQKKAKKKKKKQDCLSLIPYKSKQKRENVNHKTDNRFHRKAGKALQNEKSGGSEWMYERNNK